MPRKEDVVPAIAQPADVHTSRNSLDWAGAYEGVLPCADCPGIKTRLTLDRDGSYEISSQYLDRQPTPMIARGQFTWHAAGNAISLDARGGGQQYAVGEGRLVLLNRDGTQQMPPSSNRVLTLMPSVAAATPAVPGQVQTLEAHRWSLDSATDGHGRRIEAVAPGAGPPVRFRLCRRQAARPGRLQPDGRQLPDRCRGAAEGGPHGGNHDGLRTGEDAGRRRAVGLLARPLKVELVEGAQPMLRLTSAANDTLVLTRAAHSRGPLRCPDHRLSGSRSRDGRLQESADRRNGLPAGPRAALRRARSRRGAARRLAAALRRNRRVHAQGR